MFFVARACLLMLVVASTGAEGAPDPEIAGLVAGVSQDSLAETVHRMVAFETRFMGADSNAVAARWLHERLEVLGYREVRFDTFLVNVNRQYRVLVDSVQETHRFVFRDLPQWNVVAVKPGTLYPHRKIVLGAHYDTISIDRTQEGQDVAPGADDNASGVAALLELARLLRNAELEVTVEFVFFGAEELGLIGSEHYASQARIKGDEILAMLQLDAIGTRSTQFSDVFSIDTTHLYRKLGEVVAQAAAEYTTVRASDGAGGHVSISSTGCGCSDHQSFLNRGYPALGIFQYDGNPATHLNTSADTLEQVDLSLVTEIGKAVLASVAQMGNFPARSADFEGDGQVSLADFTLFVQAYGMAENVDLRFDLDRDGQVGFSDFVIFARNFGRQLK
ncbi:MAG: M20/M25/M40 family metallo-hydrolase [bacterium]|nr:M20/M25/M40 family metallo-hydrolase [bacterium]